MEMRPLGKTGMEVSVLGYGAAPLGGIFGEYDEAEGIATVHAVLDSGINYIDVAPYYGVLKAEIVLGKALKTIPREKFILSTKVGRYDSASFDFSAERVTRSVDESLQRLNIDYIDLILCHDIEFVDIDQIINETLPALQKVKDTGKVRAIGFSGLPLKIYPRVIDHLPVDAIISYCHFSLNDDSLATLTPYFNAKEVGVINASPLGMGLLTDNPPPWHPAGPEIRSAAVKASEICKRHGASLPSLGLSFSLTNRDVSSTLSGIANRQQLVENLACVDNPPDPELLKEVLDVLAPIHNRTWTSGLPENN